MSTDFALLDTKVTSDQRTNETSYHDWRVSLHPDRWQRASQVYSYLDAHDSTRRHERFRKCRTEAWFARNVESGLVRVLSNGCKLRWCPLCADGTRAFITRQVLDWLKCQPQPKFLTLTLKHSAAPLGFQIDNLYKFFRQLKKSKLWRKKTTGGIWFFQVKLSSQDNCWHPHLHFLLNSSYIPQSDLSALWKKITHTSCIVDIRAVRDSKKAAEYVARYCSASADLLKLPFNAAVDCVRELHGRRLCGTFGAARGVPLRTKSPPVVGEWQNVGSWWTVTRSRNSTASARHIWRAWREGLVLDSAITCSDTDQFLDGKEDIIAKLVVDVQWSQYEFDFP